MLRASRQRTERQVSRYFREQNINTRIPAVTEQAVVNMSAAARATWMEKNKEQRTRQQHISSFVDAQPRQRRQRERNVVEEQGPNKRQQLLTGMGWQRVEQSSDSEPGSSSTMTASTARKEMDGTQKKATKEKTNLITDYMATADQYRSAITPKRIRDGGLQVEEATAQVLARLSGDIRVSMADLIACARETPADANQTARRVDTADSMPDSLAEEVQGRKCLIRCGRHIIEHVCVDVWFGAESERWEVGCLPRSLYEQERLAEGWPEDKMQYLRFSDAWMRTRRWRRLCRKRKLEQRQEYERRLHTSEQPTDGGQAKRRRMAGRNTIRNFLGAKGRRKKRRKKRK